ncbi:MAG: hypothetical protein GY936_00965 [Ignavibacteriae bacterium]|nr:hypothetical protein [Ignavibacteriota bacterium]
MELTKSIQERRIGVIVTFVSLLSIVLIFEYCKSIGWNNSPIITEIILIIIFITSLVSTFFKTGLWKFTHKPLSNLDERETELTSKSLRYAYSLFTVIVLFLLLSFSLINKPLNIVLVASLILVAHMLPASVIAWTEKQINIE